MIFVLFGLPGSGKTHVAQVLRKHFNFFIHDGDDDLPPVMKKLLLTSVPISDEMRDVFFKKLITHVKILEKKYDQLIVTQTFIKNKYRKWFIQNFPKAQFVLIRVNDSLREKRLKTRREFPLEDRYAKHMVDLFEKPNIPYDTILNESEDEKEIITQFNALNLHQKKVDNP